MKSFTQSTQRVIKTIRTFLKPILILLLILLLVYLITIVKIQNYLNLEYFLEKSETISNMGALGLLLIIGIYSCVSILHLPIVFISPIPGYLFGFPLGSAVIYTGAVINLLLAFIWARFLFRNFFISLKSRVTSLQNASVKLERNGKSFIMYARIFFLTPYNVLNIVCGISDISLKDYLLASLIGALPQALFYGYIGSQVKDMSASDNIWLKGTVVSVVVIVFFIGINVIKKYALKKLK
ncbi:TVP38/TMEM64 family protein [Spirochaetota bacterium]